jgi:hypothetical protein
VRVHQNPMLCRSFSRFTFRRCLGCRLLFCFFSRFDPVQYRGVEERLWRVAGVEDRDCFLRQRMMNT